jgi:hypothetical protein
MIKTSYMFQGLKTSNGLLWSRDTTDTFEYAMGCEVVGIEFDGLQTLEARSTEIGASDICKLWRPRSLKLPGWAKRRP